MEAFKRLNVKGKNKTYINPNLPVDKRNAVFNWMVNAVQVEYVPNDRFYDLADFVLKNANTSAISGVPIADKFTDGDINLMRKALRIKCGAGKQYVVSAYVNELLPSAKRLAEVLGA